jgi:DNA-binding XRE family transcriptional regulator
LSVPEKKRGTSPGDTPGASWSGADLKCSRESLGLTQVSLASFLGWKHTRISEIESGRRTLPEWVMEQMLFLEGARAQLVESMLMHLGEHMPDADLVVHSTDASYAAAHPTDPAIPAAVQRVAAALAAAEWERRTGERPGIVLADS